MNVSVLMVVVLIRALMVVVVAALALESSGALQLAGFVVAGLFAFGTYPAVTDALTKMNK
jgi:hypothetical protein